MDIRNLCAQASLLFEVIYLEGESQSHLLVLCAIV